MGKWKPLPGETPLDDISGLKIKSIRTRRKLFIAEAENIRKAVVKYLANKPTQRQASFELGWMLKLHREMFGDVWSWAGTVRTSDLNLGVPWYQVESALKLWAEDLRFWETNWPDIWEQSASLHHRAVQIQPFLNGNGRWARMLANIWLYLHDEPITIWPEETIGSVSTIRDEYLAAVRRADRGDLTTLVELHKKYAESDAHDAD